MLRQAHLDDRCQVETYGSYLTKMTQGAIDLNKVDESVIRQNLVDQSYDYVIVDEAQDVADKGWLLCWTNSRQPNIQVFKRAVSCVI